MVIEDDNQEVILTVNTSLTAFDYTLDDHEFCRTYEVKVAGINGVGIGEYCRSVNLTLRCKCRCISEIGEIFQYIVSNNDGVSLT